MVIVLQLGVRVRVKSHVGEKEGGAEEEMVDFCGITVLAGRIPVHFLFKMPMEMSFLPFEVPLLSVCCQGM